MYVTQLIVKYNNTIIITTLWLADNSLLLLAVWSTTTSFIIILDRDVNMITLLRLKQLSESCSNNNIKCVMKCVYNLFPQTVHKKKRHKTYHLVITLEKKTEKREREKPAKYAGYLTSNLLLLHSFQTHFLYKKLCKQCQYAGLQSPCVCI